jgi:hypothetical protein
MTYSDPDLDSLLDEALRQHRLRRPAHREKNETHLDYAKRLAEKGLYRRLAREANAQIDAQRFEFWFTNEGAEGLTLDQWRVLIDIQMEKSHERMARQDSLDAKEASANETSQVAQAQ